MGTKLLLANRWEWIATYKYQQGNNKLGWIDDAIPVGNYSQDIDKQQPGNYQYDSIGNLVKDVSAGIRVIDWTLYGKIRDIVKENGDSILYTYDVSGNRISKRYLDTTTWYVRDATGNVMMTYVQRGSAPLTQLDASLYGSSRLGVINFDNQRNNIADEDVVLPGLGNGQITNFVRGSKVFELSNHLRNVLATVTDKKLLGDGGLYSFDLSSAVEYYPFGMQMPGRAYESGGYRYGFNGKENDNEVKREENQQDYGLRIYDPRIGKFLSVDPTK
ncbi:RHS repeat-associated core domain-containing protein [Chitinophaga rhizophila]|uniref:YD repeat-containing protein n=1 Tax=Chitinophaga rhizophila TaxID=2866212 RepID=A0ABS7GIB1_9BACT|nr:hypothetical protein [Chitinophaga rhizophila]MBW8686985.1 hypothetical protein [Chitinophaga rhizophila]